MVATAGTQGLNESSSSELDVLTPVRLVVPFDYVSLTKSLEYVDIRPCGGVLRIRWQN